MSLAPGSRLGPHEVVALIGAGGMGEVWLAHDTKLGRDVALKILPDAFALDPDRLVRFKREAHVLASLNHPNIAQIYGLEESDRGHALVMELVEGQTLSEMIASGPLALDLAISITRQTVDALEAAHARGIIHRDLKPANIKITPGGKVKVLDFGLAREISADQSGADSRDSTTTEVVATQSGVLLGTVAYMSPEQAAGGRADARSDIFAVGVVLYEMLCGRRPFGGHTRLETLASVLQSKPEEPRHLRPEIPLHLERVILRCLQKQPEARFDSAGDLGRALSAFEKRRAGVTIRRPIAVAAVAALAVVGITLGARAYTVASRVRWAETTALAEVARLMGEVRPMAALAVLREAEQYIPDSFELNRLKEDLLIAPVTIETTPAGVEVYAADYRGTGSDDEWRLLGTSPVQTDWLPRGYYRFRVAGDGIGPFEFARTVSEFLPDGIVRIDLPPETAPAGMVWVPRVPAQFRGNPWVTTSAVREPLPGYWIDRHEVTNAEFRQFVDRGGYRDSTFWRFPLVTEGGAVSFETMMGQFVDPTGRPGPATWELGAYPENRSNFPVGGVSFFEAAAYCEGMGKQLPTFYHWFFAAGSNEEVLGVSNFGTQGSAAVEQYRGLGLFGTYDMAGNVKEWVVNPNGNERFILGGGWTDPDYMFRRPDARRPVDRDPTFGFRCVQYGSPPPSEVSGPVLLVDRDRRGDPDIDDATYRLYRGLHDYDRTALNPSQPVVDDGAPYWIREDVSIDAAYGGERIVLHVHVPKNARPPYQVAIFMGGTTVLSATSVEGARDTTAYDFILRSGRAVVVPAYQGTLERGPGAYYHRQGQPNLWRDMNLNWSKDLGRTIDYLETRGDIDASRLAFYGFSMGAAMAPRLVAVEPRIRTAVLFLGGSFERVPPEVDAWHFAPRVSVPVLMLNGENDANFPLEASQIPLFERLGTTDKRRVTYPGGHDVGNSASRQNFIREFLAWLDRILGPVATAS